MRHQIQCLRPRSGLVREACGCTVRSSSFGPRFKSVAGKQMTASEGKPAAAGVDHCHPRTTDAGITATAVKRRLCQAQSRSPAGLALSKFSVGPDYWPLQPCSYCTTVAHCQPLNHRRSAISRRGRCCSTSQLPGWMSLGGAVACP